MTSYYSDLHALRDKLKTRYPDSYLLIVSVANTLKGSTAGNIVEVDFTIGARCLLNGTHREATPEEVQKFREAQSLTQAKTTSNPLDSARRQFGLLVTKKGDSHA